MNAVLYKIIVLAGILNGIFCKFGQNCNVSTELTNSACLESEFCDPETSKCGCGLGFVLKNSECVTTSINKADSVKTDGQVNPNDDSSGSIAAGILIPLVLILFVISGWYIFKKYDLMVWFRTKLFRRNSNYDEFMIGNDIDDDPPLR